MMKLILITLSLVFITAEVFSKETPRSPLQKTLSENETKSNAVSPTTRQLSSQENSSPKNPSPTPSERKINQELKQGKQTKSHKKTQKPSRQLNAQNLSEGETEFKELLLMIQSRLNRLSHICLQEKPLYEKALQFQRSLDQIKALTLSAQELMSTYNIHFKRPVRSIFPINIFYSYVYEDSSFNYKKNLSTDQTILKQQLQDLSFVFQHTYKSSFNHVGDLPIEEYAEFAKGIALALDCLSQ